MSLHFAPAYVPGRAPVCLPDAKAMIARAVKRTANDNGGNNILGTNLAANDQMLHAALRHFAQHGLGAAREARSRAEDAFFTGDRKAYDWWLGITRTLDRRLAQQTDQFSPETAKT